MVDHPVLVIEDDPAAATALARLLAAGTERPLVVETRAEDAVRRLSATPVRCVVLDLSLAQGGAQQVLACLCGGGGAASGGPTPVPIVAVAGPGDEGATLIAAESGVQTLLPAQGLTPARLRLGIQHAIRRWRAHDPALGGSPAPPARRILVVDDSDIDHRIVARTLAAETASMFEVAQAFSGAEGLRRLRGEPFDCVLLDYDLADMTGLEFLREVATPGSGVPSTPIVVVTGHGSEAIAVEALRLGALDYRVKDRGQDDQLARVIDRAIDRMALRRRLARSLWDLSAANLALAEEVATREEAEAAARAARDAAEQANLAKSRFVALISHELRTPLNAILGYAQLLGLEGDLTAEQAGRVTAMARAGAHLLHLIEHVLDYSAIETGRIELREEHFALQDLAAACIELVMPAALERRLALRLVADAAAPGWLRADLGRLRQVILNLLGNAVKFTTEGSVELRLLPGPEGGLLVEVADTGRGIPPDKAGRLFSEFERLSPVGTIEGAGLGLAISLRFVRLMGGDITHRPDPRGGSIFAVSLPAALCADPPAEPGGPAIAPRVAERPGLPLHVLVADDFPPNRDVMDGFLRAAGHSVAFAEDGLEALEAAQCGTFDVILMDVLMPRMGGIEATRHIRALPAPAGRVPIIALSAQAFRETVEACLAAGMDAHCAKPIDFDRLLATIQRIVHEREESLIVAAAPTPSHGARSLAVFDPAAFERIAQYMDAPRLRACLDGLERVATELRDALGTGALDRRALRELAHTLAGSAGTFGLAQLSSVAHRFSRALDDPDAAMLPEEAPLAGALMRACAELARLRGSCAVS